MSQTAFIFVTIIVSALALHSLTLKKTAWNATMIGSASSFYSRDKYSPNYIVRQLFVAIELRLGEENKATVRCKMFSKRLVI
jgi:hypothetical protein